MKALYTTKTGNIRFEIEGATQKELFRQLASLQEIFEEECCALCKSKDIRFMVRNVEENDFFEMFCKSCRAKLAFGQNKKGGALFPIRQLTKDGKPDRAEGKWGPHNGWHKYQGATK